MQLSPHFSREEFEHSNTAIARGIVNHMGDVEMAAARSLCTNILEPIRAHFGKPMSINSGYRCVELNKAVGSKPGSQHQRGEAADFEIPGIANGLIAQYIRDSTLDFDQLILEAYTPGQPSSGWVHVSRSITGRQRRQVLTMTLGSHGASYSQGIHS